MAAVGGVCPFGLFTVVETWAWPKTPETVVGSIPAPISKLVCKCLHHMNNTCIKLDILPLQSKYLTLSHTS